MTTLETPKQGSNSQKTHGGIFYPNSFNPERLLDITEDLIDTTVMHELNPFTGQNLMGPKRHFLSTSRLQDETKASKVDFLTRELSDYHKKWATLYLTQWSQY
jgi:hypothetical protein